VLVRRWNVSPLEAVTAIIACRESEDNDSRIMTPAFAQGFVFCRLVTRATIVPSPVSGW
jgi:hypothetical protein